MSKTNLKTQAYNIIRERIVNCEYEPGTFLNETILTEELGLSRTPIRDALGRLEQEGLIEIKSKKGIIVTPLSEDRINMIFEVRMLCEPYILRHYGSMIPYDQLRKFYNILQQPDVTKRCLEDRHFFYDLDSQFHDLLVSSCPNIYLKANYSMIQTQNERYRHLTGEDSKTRMLDTVNEHLAILEPCLRGDWDEAAERLNYHLNESKKASYRIVLKSFKDQQTASQ